MLENSTSLEVLVKCNHTTNFAVLTRPKQVRFSASHILQVNHCIIYMIKYDSIHN